MGQTVIWNSRRMSPGGPGKENDHNGNEKENRTTVTASCPSPTTASGTRPAVLAASLPALALLVAQRLAVPEPGRTRVVDHLSVDRAFLGLVLGKDDAMAAPAREERRLRSHEAEQGGGGEEK